MYVTATKPIVEEDKYTIFADDEKENLEEELRLEEYEFVFDEPVKAKDLLN